MSKYLCKQYDPQEQANIPLHAEENSIQLTSTVYYTQLHNIVHVHFTQKILKAIDKGNTDIEMFKIKIVVVAKANNAFNPIIVLFNMFNT